MPSKDTVLADGRKYIGDLLQILPNQVMRVTPEAVAVGHAFVNQVARTQNAIAKKFTSPEILDSQLKAIATVKDMAAYAISTFGKESQAVDTAARTKRRFERSIMADPYESWPIVKQIRMRREGIAEKKIVAVSGEAFMLMYRDVSTTGSPKGYIQVHLP